MRGVASAVDVVSWSWRAAGIRAIALPRWATEDEATALLKAVYRGPPSRANRRRPRCVPRPPISGAVEATRAPVLPGRLAGRWPLNGARVTRTVAAAGRRVRHRSGKKSRPRATSMMFFAAPTSGTAFNPVSSAPLITPFRRIVDATVATAMAAPIHGSDRETRVSTILRPPNWRVDGHRHSQWTRASCLVPSGS